MPSEYLLDTNTVVYYFHDVPSVLSQMALHRPTFLPFVTVAELLYGAKRSARAPVNLRLYQEFLAKFGILYPSRITLDLQSDLRLALQKLGRPIPDNDLWQAALAIQHHAVLVTNDAHFAVVPGLRTENWTLSDG